METTLNRVGDESAEEREKLTDKPESKEPELKEPGTKEPETKQTKSHRWEPQAYRAHDFAHVHPTHAKHKSFGIDHEPGAF